MAYKEFNSLSAIRSRSRQSNRPIKGSDSPDPNRCEPRVASDGASATRPHQEPTDQNLKPPLGHPFAASLKYLESEPLLIRSGGRVRMRRSAPFQRHHAPRALNRRDEPVETTLTLKTDSCPYSRWSCLGFDEDSHAPAPAQPNRTFPARRPVQARGDPRDRADRRHRRRQESRGGAAGRIGCVCHRRRRGGSRPARSARRCANRWWRGSAPRSSIRSASPEEPPRIDRRALGTIVFANPEALRQLEAILHPRMRRTFERAIARTVRRGQARAVVLDAAILLEAGWHTLCDRIVLVDAPREQRLARLAAARGWSEQTLAAREAAQWPLERSAPWPTRSSSTTPALEPLEEHVRRLADAVFRPLASHPSVPPREVRDRWYHAPRPVRTRTCRPMRPGGPEFRRGGRPGGEFST